ncbi:ester cyclase [Roseiflexus sp.]
MPHSNAESAVQEANKTAALRFYEEVINGEQKPVIDEICATDMLVHDPFTGAHRGVAAFKDLLGLFDAAFPHHRVVVERAIAEGDFVAVLHTHHATHTGPFMGLPPTGRSVVVNGLELFRFADGRIVEFWRKDDDTSLLMQLGLLAAPQPG